MWLTVLLTKNDRHLRRKLAINYDISDAAFN
jgi:hypothetical protein